MFPACTSTCVIPPGLQQHPQHCSTSTPLNTFPTFLGLQKVSQVCSCATPAGSWPWLGLATISASTPVPNRALQKSNPLKGLSQQRTSYSFFIPGLTESSLNLSLNQSSLTSLNILVNCAFHRAQIYVQQCWGTTLSSRQLKPWHTLPQPSPWQPRLCVQSSSSLVLLS